MVYPRVRAIVPLKRRIMELFGRATVGTKRHFFQANKTIFKVWGKRYLEL